MLILRLQSRTQRWISCIQSQFIFFSLSVSLILFMGNVKYLHKFKKVKKMLFSILNEHWKSIVYFGTKNYVRMWSTKTFNKKKITFTNNISSQTYFNIIYNSSEKSRMWREKKRIQCRYFNQRVLYFYDFKLSLTEEETKKHLQKREWGIKIQMTQTTKLNFMYFRWNNYHLCVVCY